MIRRMFSLSFRLNPINEKAAVEDQKNEVLDSPLN